MPPTLVQPIVLPNKIDKEIIAFWKLKNRYDHVNHFHTHLNELCEQLAGVQQPPPDSPSKPSKEVELNIDKEVSQTEPSISLDGSQSERPALVLPSDSEVTCPEIIDVPPEVDDPGEEEVNLIHLPPETDISSSSEEKEIPISTLSPDVQDNFQEERDNSKSELQDNSQEDKDSSKSDTKSLTTSGSSPYVDLDQDSSTETLLNLPAETEKKMEWQIVNRDGQFFCQLVSDIGEVVASQGKGPFSSLDEARESIREVALMEHSNDQ